MTENLFIGITILLHIVAVTMILPVGFVVYCWSLFCYAEAQPEQNRHVKEKPKQQLPKIGTEEASQIEVVLGLPKSSLSVKVLEDFRYTILNPRNNLRYFLWYVSIFGIGISVVPAIIVFYPFIEPLLTYLNKMKWIYEVLAYFICTRFIVIAHHNESKYRDIMALTGLVLSIPAFIVTSWVHDTDLTGAYGGLFLFMSSLPMTYLFRSRIIGFVNIASVFHTLGFLVVPMDSGYIVGFDDYTRVDTALLASFTMIMMYFSGILEYFHSGMSVLGPCVFGIAGLIKCSHTHDNLYIHTNVAYISLLSSFILLSTIYKKNAVFNASTVFIVMWILEKSITYVGNYTWFVVLGASVGLWRHLAVKSLPKVLVKNTYNS